MSEAFFGVGWAFPVETAPRQPVGEPLGSAPLVPPPVEEEGRIALSREERSIRESIMLIVATARGERVMRPTFGCGLHELVYEPNDSMTAARASLEIRESLIDWEPRIEVLGVSAGPDPSEADKLLIELDYRVRKTNNVFNLVYPFYLRSAGAQSR
jgi:phage baseplate assembly protein W